MTNFGTIGEFCADEETFSSYSERVEAYFLANEIKDGEKKKAILVTVIGARTYKLLRDLLIPKKPMEVTVQVLLETLTIHYEPIPCEIVERFRFNTCDRQDNQKIVDYIAELRRRSEHCNYGNKLDEHIRDRLVCGVKNNRIQRRLLSEEKLTLKRAIEIAVGLELAELNLATIDSCHNNNSVINKIDYTRHNKRKEEEIGSKVEHSRNDKYKLKCTGCGNNGHEVDKCRWKKCKCYTCGKLGHLKYKCPHKETNYLTQEADDEELIYSMFTVETKEDGVMTTTLRFNDISCTLQVDTGAAVSIISEKTMKELWKPSKQPKLLSSSVKLRTFTNELIPVMGRIDVKTDEGKYIKLYVVRGSVPNIAGRDLIKLL